MNKGRGIIELGHNGMVTLDVRHRCGCHARYAFRGVEYAILGFDRYVNCVKCVKCGYQK